MTLALKTILWFAIPSAIMIAGEQSGLLDTVYGIDGMGEVIL